MLTMMKKVDLTKNRVYYIAGKIIIVKGLYFNMGGYGQW